LRAATNGDWALGNARFKHQIAKALGRRVVPLPKGRPRKVTATRRQLNRL
jgi:putative transposase